uniref:Uncharacterized protein n=2 Tax=Opuntia streptacantha TaxID=393608 RepID=A0A7C9E6Z0_OPUST
MQSGRHNFNNTMNFHSPHHQIDRFPSQNPPIYSSYGFQSRPSFQSHQHPKPPINPPPPTLPYDHGGYSDYEQRLRDEVIYLHSLWRRGPPQVQGHINNNTQSGFHFIEVRENSGIRGLNPSSIPLQIQNPHLKPLPTIPCKKKKNKKKKKPNKTQIVSDKEWPVDPKPTFPSPPGHGWGEFKTRTFPQTRPAPAQEQERVLAVRVHLKGLDSCIGFFKKSSDEGEEEEDDDDDEEEYDEEEVFEFFLMMFEEDEKLREYYKAKCENGEFYCLVCGVIVNKLGRKYKDCVALVQHSVTISKTKKKIAHRAYGRVLCKVLGWDIDRLPSLPSTLVGGANAVVETPLPQVDSTSANCRS